MGQGGDPFREHRSEGGDVGCSHLDEIIEGAGYEMAFLDFRNPPDGNIEGIESSELGVGEADLNEGNVPAPQRIMVEHGAVTPYYSAFFQTP